MNNSDHWQRMCLNLDSPQSYIDVGWLFTVSAALQRRVWTGSEQMPLFPNMYIWLMGPPGIGKGLVLTTVKRLLKHHKQQGAGVVQIKTASGTETPSKISISADNTTYEGLLADMTRSTRFIRITDTRTGKLRMISSIPYVILLEELSSLIKEKNMDMGQLLLRLFEANDYDYKLKGGSDAILRDTCTSMMAGTTPAFLKQAARMRLFDDGLTARVLMICADRRRFDKFNISDFNDDQRESQAILLNWIDKLLGLYGNLVIPPKLMEYIEDWYAHTYPTEVATADESMKAYYGRKRVHFMKLAMAFHFSESLSMTMSAEAVMNAIQFLSHVEKQTALVMAKSSSNWKYTVGQTILEHLFETGRPLTTAQIVQKFGRAAQSDVLLEIIKDLVIATDITLDIKNGVTTYRVSDVYRKRKEAALHDAVGQLAAAADDDTERRVRELVEPN